MSRNSRFGGAKSKIWLKIGLYTVKFVLVLGAIGTPFATHAGVFSFLTDLLGNKQASADVTSSASGFSGVLQANVGPDSISGNDGAQIAMVDDSALLQESGIYGTQVDTPDSQSTQISLYVVRQGDSLSQIAKMYDVSVNTIIWANNITGPIHEGDQLIMLPVSGVSHVIVKGDTVRSIASKYHADMGDIMSYNGIHSDSDLVVGSTVIIPDGESAPPAPSAISPHGSNPTEKLHDAGGPYYPGYYMRPIDGGVKTQGLHGYNAVDLAAPIGTPIHAAADGVVIIAKSGGYNGGYGSYVAISHPNGTETLYAHMSKVIAVRGQTVQKGETIGLIGSTGWSTGPHVHFEIRGAVNPF